jgi:hypothetical protein
LALFRGGTRSGNRFPCDIRGMNAAVGCTIRCMEAAVLSISPDALAIEALLIAVENALEITFDERRAALENWRDHLQLQLADALAEEFEDDDELAA